MVRMNDGNYSMCAGFPLVEGGSSIFSIQFPRFGPVPIRTILTSDIKSIDNSAYQEIDRTGQLYKWKIKTQTNMTLKRGDKGGNTESVDELRQRLNNMKKMMAERQGLDLDEGRRSTNMGVIDGSFLSVVFGAALAVILTVSIYAFYNLYSAILKKFPDSHEEL
ncbi:hypothetical protein NQ317_007009 [Molorchus minor]|uniref:Uncharacterized protein n=1 Tax=Molorchus minor TaxID=1323400 RepID=A0ABQ9JT79_9CUCU|nr:hypothetical protein NQ317_007009 [Molorchus minor]